MEKKLISIFTPIHKYNEVFFKDLYDSVINQTYQNWEWVIVLNGEIGINDLPIYDQRCRVIDEGIENDNIGYLKNKCCLHCNGEILVELDYDDMLITDALSLIAESFKDENVHFTYSNCIEFNGEFKDLNSHTYSSYYGWKIRDNNGHKELIAFPAAPQYLRRIEWAPNHVRSFRKSSYNKIGEYDVTLEGGDDHDLMCRFYIEYGQSSFHHIDKAIYLYRRHDSNTSGYGDSSKLNNIQKQVDLNYIKYFEKMMIKWCIDNKYGAIDLGGRFNCPLGYTSVDLLDADIIMDLNKDWDQIEDNSLGIIRAYHLLEHLDDPIHFFNQAYKKLVSGGVLMLEVPSTNNGGLGAFSDPTHKSFFNIRSIEYYTNQAISQYIQPQYNGRFQKSRVVEYMWNDGCCVLSAQLIALKGEYEKNWCGEKLMYPPVNETQDIIQEKAIEEKKVIKKKRAVFTIVKNEKYFLPIWLKYYNKAFNKEDIYILDHQSTDSSTDCLNVNVIKIENDKIFDHEWLRNIVNSFQAKLLEEYETVVFAEADELILPRYVSLNEYLDSFNKDYVSCTGYEIFHDVYSENTFNPNLPIFSQRKYWFRTDIYDKTIISKKPCNWSLGFHFAEISSIYKNKDDDLLLIHLHRLDYNIHMDRKKAFWDETYADEDPLLGIQNKLKEEKDIREFFFKPQAIGIVFPIDISVEGRL